MSKSFKHKGLEAFFFQGTLKGIQAKHSKRLLFILELLNAAKEATDMNYPGSHLHSLKGKMKGLWALFVSGNWRVVFCFKDSNAHDVDYLDYH